MTRRTVLETGEKKLGDLRNIGKAMLADFSLLKIESVESLAGCDSLELYERLQRLTGHRQDPCVVDDELNFAVFGGDRPRCRFDGSTIYDVCGKDWEGRLAGVTVEPHDREVNGECVSDRPADRAGGAGNYGDGFVGHTGGMSVRSSRSSSVSRAASHASPYHDLSWTTSRSLI